jgi:riboflavin synthase
VFTGIVEELGAVVSRKGPRLRIAARTVLDDVTMGASIAVNGCCLTVVGWDRDEGWWEADVVDETYARSSLGALAPGHRVNLERPVRLSDRLGGHLVQGHVDAVGHVVRREPGEHWDVVTVAMPRKLAPYLVDKGSITVDGVSLTVVEARDDEFTVSLIPETLRRTTLGFRAPGDAVNLEVDVIGKYVARQLELREAVAR